MKTKLLFLALLLPLFHCSFADSGGGNRIGCHINCMDVDQNLFFYSIDEKVQVQVKKGKTEEYEMTRNIAIYDISNKKTSYLFPETFKDGITDLYFESHYDTQNKMMVFNSDNSSNYENTMGNMNMKERGACGKLIIVTFSYETRMFSVWTADKKGTNLKKIHEYPENNSFDIDAKNQVLRFVYEKGTAVEVKDIAYCE